MSLIADILDRRDKQISEIRQRAKGFETEADRRDIARIHQESDEQIKALLSDQEARALRTEEFKYTDLGKALMEHFAPNPDELAAISDHEKAVADVIATAGDLEGVQSRSLERLEKILGPDRLNEFLNYRADPNYAELLAFLKRFNFPPETATDLLKLRFENEKIILERLKKGQSPTDPNRTETFRSRVKELLGVEAGEIYIREAKGAGWLR